MINSSVKRVIRALEFAFELGLGLCVDLYTNEYARNHGQVVFTALKGLLSLSTALFSLSLPAYNGYTALGLLVVSGLSMIHVAMITLIYASAHCTATYCFVLACWLVVICSMRISVTRRLTDGSFAAIGFTLAMVGISLARLSNKNAYMDFSLEEINTIGPRLNPFYTIPGGSRLKDMWQVIVRHAMSTAGIAAGRTEFLSEPSEWRGFLPPPNAPTLPPLPTFPPIPTLPPNTELTSSGVRVYYTRVWTNTVAGKLIWGWTAEDGTNVLGVVPCLVVLQLLVGAMQLVFAMFHPSRRHDHFKWLRNIVTATYEDSARYIRHWSVNPESLNLRLPHDLQIKGFLDEALTQEGIFNEAEDRLKNRRASLLPSFDEEEEEPQTFSMNDEKSESSQYEGSPSRVEGEPRATDTCPSLTADGLGSKLESFLHNLETHRTEMAIVSLFESPIARWGEMYWRELKRVLQCYNHLNRSLQNMALLGALLQCREGRSVQINRDEVVGEDDVYQSHFSHLNVAITAKNKYDSDDIIEDFARQIIADPIANYDCEDVLDLNFRAGKLSDLLSFLSLHHSEALAPFNHLSIRCSSKQEEQVVYSIRAAKLGIDCCRPDFKKGSRMTLVECVSLDVFERIEKLQEALEEFHIGRKAVRPYKLVLAFTVSIVGGVVTASYHALVPLATNPFKFFKQNCFAQLYSRLLIGLWLLLITVMGSNLHSICFTDTCGSDDSGSLVFDKMKEAGMVGEQFGEWIILQFIVTQYLPIETVVARSLLRALGVPLYFIALVAVPNMTQWWTVVLQTIVFGFLVMLVGARPDDPWFGLEQSTAYFFQALTYGYFVIFFYLYEQPSAMEEIYLARAAATVCGLAFSILWAVLLDAPTGSFIITDRARSILINLSAAMTSAAVPESMSGDSLDSHVHKQCRGLVKSLDFDSFLGDIVTCDENLAPHDGNWLVARTLCTFNNKKKLPWWKKMLKSTSPKNGEWREFVASNEEHIKTLRLLEADIGYVTLPLIGVRSGLVNVKMLLWELQVTLVMVVEDSTAFLLAIDNASNPEAKDLNDAKLLRSLMLETADLLWRARDIFGTASSAAQVMAVTKFFHVFLRLPVWLPTTGAHPDFCKAVLGLRLIRVHLRRIFVDTHRDDSRFRFKQLMPSDKSEYGEAPLFTTPPIGISMTSTPLPQASELDIRPRLRCANRNDIVLGGRGGGTVEMKKASSSSSSAAQGESIEESQSSFEVSQL